MNDQKILKGILKIIDRDAYLFAQMPAGYDVMKRKIYIQFGEWAVWREYNTHAAARAGLRYWRQRCSWPLKLGK